MSTPKKPRPNLALLTRIDALEDMVNDLNIQISNLLWSEKSHLDRIHHLENVLTDMVRITFPQKRKALVTYAGRN